MVTIQIIKRKKVEKSPETALRGGRRRRRNPSG